MLVPLFFCFLLAAFGGDEMCCLLRCAFELVRLCDEAAFVCDIVIGDCSF
jgi:hypothetical protein